MRGACHSKTRLFSFLSWHALPGLLLPTASYVLCPVFVARLYLLSTQPLLYRDFASLTFSLLSLLSTSNPRLQCASASRAGVGVALLPLPKAEAVRTPRNGT